MKKNSASAVLFTLVLVLAMSISGAVSTRLAAESAEFNNGNDPIVGTWDITITGTPFKILRSYNAGGTIVDAYAFPPITFTAGPLVNSAGHGEWVRTGRGQYKAIVKYFQIDPTQNATFQVLNSFGIVREFVSLDAKTGAYSSSFTTEVHTPTGQILLTNGGQTTGTAVKVDF